MGGGEGGGWGVEGVLGGGVADWEWGLGRWGVWCEVLVA